jgi:hypothetical protein
MHPSLDAKRFRVSEMANEGEAGAATSSNITSATASSGRGTRAALFGSASWSGYETATASSFAIAS